MSDADKTWFDGLERKFDDVDTETGINTQQFIEASRSLVTLFDLLGSTTFSTVITDMNGNIKKLNDRYTAAPDRSATLQSLVHEEHKELGKKATATEGLMWLFRGFEFTSKALRHNISNPEEELATSFQESYNGTLKQYHNFVVKGLFSVALKATPYRKDFYAKLGADKKKVDDQAVAWLSALEGITATMQKEYADNKNFGF
ncbi:hypothetical protein TWF788_005797 [Orbilia oligospora]|uniref:Glycolipid transfer protein domain-containing protein n=1 Tax=Orbilia oligospora TaxID=2813651 RepID=A0A7C8PXK9_ORBOL|nr:hypothetical protein TWF788_005797 [Orbilia oligospora]KAF3202935.1 hypothetical protein TWF679_010574 [Orbilia oligospora]